MGASGLLANGSPGAATPITHCEPQEITFTVPRAPDTLSALTAVAVAWPAMVLPVTTPLVVTKMRNGDDSEASAGMSGRSHTNDVLSPMNRHVGVVAGRFRPPLIAPRSNGRSVVVLFGAVADASMMRRTWCATTPELFVTCTGHAASPLAVMESTMGGVVAAICSVACGTVKLKSAEVVV